MESINIKYTILLYTITFDLEQMFADPCINNGREFMQKFIHIWPQLLVNS
jgi:hypothetical protein